MLQIFEAYVLVFNFGKDKQNSNLYFNLNDLKKTGKKRRRCLGLLQLLPWSYFQAVNKKVD